MFWWGGGRKNVEYAVPKQYTFRLELCLYRQELSNVTEMYDLFGEISFSGPYGMRRGKDKTVSSALVKNWKSKVWRKQLSFSFACISRFISLIFIFLETDQSWG